MDEFEAINGVGASEVDTLHEAGYECIEDIQAASQSEFSEINGIGKAPRHANRKPALATSKSVRRSKGQRQTQHRGRDRGDRL